MPWWIASLVSILGITIVEYQNRTWNGTFFELLPYTVWFIALAQWGLFYSWNKAPSMLVAWAFFAAGNMAMRLVSNYYFVGEQMDWRHVTIVGMMFGCVYLMKRLG